MTMQVSKPALVIPIWLFLSVKTVVNVINSNLVILIKFSLCLADKKDITKLKIASDNESIL